MSVLALFPLTFVACDKEKAIHIDYSLKISGHVSGSGTVCQVFRLTIKILKIWAGKIITAIVLKMEQFGFKCIYIMLHQCCR